jgi:transposase
MLNKGKKDFGQGEIIYMDELVPDNHLLRKIDNAVDFTRIYDFTEKLYCVNNGRPSVDPVVLFKMVLLQHLYGLPSLRRTAEEVSLNAAYRWFLGYTWREKTPHFATLSYNFKHRFSEETIEEVFNWILYEIEHAGYLSPEAVFIDGTHIKANANIKKNVIKSIPKAAKIYEEQLMNEINRGREIQGKKPFPPNDNPSEQKEITVSTTDPESGLFHKGEHEKCFAYEAHTACDKNGFVLDVEVTAGNVHDSVAFDNLYDKVVENHPEVKVIVADSAYKTPWICKKIIDGGRIPAMPYVRPKTKDLGHKWHEYVYDDYYDCVICPAFRVLEYSTSNRNGYREYRSNPKFCSYCITRHKCTENAKFVKTVAKHIWSDYIEQAEDYRHTPNIKAIYERRKETIERVFADAKEKHAMRYTRYRGLAQVAKWVRLKFAYMNLKKLANRLWKHCFCIRFWTILEF